MSLGANVKKLRERAGLTQTELAGRAGMDQQALAALERRDSKSSSFAPALALALGVSINELMGGDQGGSDENDVLLRPDEIVQLIELYSNATKDGRESIMRMARTVEARYPSRRAGTTDDQF